MRLFRKGLANDRADASGPPWAALGIAQRGIRAAEVDAMRKCLSVGLIWSAACTAGCSSSLEWSKEPEAIAGLTGRALEVYVAVPANGVFENAVYADSGRLTAAAVEAAFRPKAQRVICGSEPETADSAVEKARAQGCNLVVFPTILHWEDRNTEWSGKPDRIEVRLDLVDVSTGDVLDTTTFTGASSWATFGGDHPQDLLQEPLEQYASVVGAAET
jgi:hypothetical protein